jgi:hypothetical protein
MKATQLIAALEALVAEHGDCDVLLSQDDDSWRDMKDAWATQACRYDDGVWPAPADGTVPETPFIALD